MGIEGKLLVSRKNIVVNKESIGIDNDLTKDRNMNTFKTYCKRRKSGARLPDRKANNRLCACHCIAGNEHVALQSAVKVFYSTVATAQLAVHTKTESSGFVGNLIRQRHSVESLSDSVSKRAVVGKRSSLREAVTCTT